MCDASSGSLSSYAYIILLLHYLQQVKPPVIPVLQQVSFDTACVYACHVTCSVYSSNQIGEGGLVDVDGWNCRFHRFDNLSQLVS